MVLIVVPVAGFDRDMAEWDYLGEVMILTVGETIEEPRLAVTVAALVLIFVPICLISCYSPFAVRLLLMSTDASGRQVGNVYGISTFGNILGVLVTSFWLIPALGSRAITLIFAGVIVASGLFLIRLGKVRRNG